MSAQRRHIRPTARLYTLLAILACLALIIPVIASGITLAQQEAQLNNLKQQRNELCYRNSALRREVAFSDTDAFVIRKARMLGMAFPGETVYATGAEVR